MPVTALETGLYSILSGNSALTTELGGTLIYNKQAPQGPGTKFVVFNWAGGGDENLTPHRTRNVVYTVQAVATTQAQAATLDRLIDAALHEKTLTVSGWTNFWTAREDDISYVEQDAGGNPIFHVGAQYRIRIDDD